MRLRFAGLTFLVLLPAGVTAQAGKFPPDTLVNTKVFAHATPVTQVIGAMRNFTSDLGVRCQFCHVGREGQPLDQFDFTSDEKRTKLVARQMMLMVQEINRRVDTLPRAGTVALQVTCGTCHRGVSRPAPLFAVVADIGTASGADSAVRAYKALCNRYYGSGSYDFGETSLNTAAFRLARANRFDEALALLTLNEEQFPASATLSVLRGNIALMRNDTTAAEAALREALRRDPNNAEAKGRLQAIGRP